MDRQETHALLAEAQALYHQALTAGKGFVEAAKAAQDHWNSWAQGMLELQRKLKSDKRWTRARKFENNNEETRAWHRAAVAEFSSLEEPWCPSDDQYFSNFVFPGAAHFDGAQFGNAAFFLRSVFYGDARFVQARFSSKFAPLSGIQFKANADFSEAHFVHEADFATSRFRGDASFRAAYIGAVASFTETHFAKQVDFSEAKFNDQAIFAMARFDGDANFENARFGGTAGMVGCTFGSPLRLSGTMFCGQATFLMPQEWTEGAQFAVEPVFITESDLSPPSTEL